MNVDALVLTAASILIAMLAQLGRYSIWKNRTSELDDGTGRVYKAKARNFALLFIVMVIAILLALGSVVWFFLTLNL